MAASPEMSENVRELLDRETTRLRSALRETHQGGLLWANECAMWLLNDVADRQQKRLETGKASSGLSTGIAILDETLTG